MSHDVEGRRYNWLAWLSSLTVQRVSSPGMGRQYELKRRAERQDQTRQRIVDATIELHKSIGAAQTTISAIAKRAGVARGPVSRHSPDEGTLFAACSGPFFSQHPFPDIERWRQIRDPRDRLREGL